MSAAAAPLPPITYVTWLESEYITIPDGEPAGTGTGRANAATSTYELVLPVSYVNGFLKFAPPCGSSGSSVVAAAAYVPLFCTP